MKKIIFRKIFFDSLFFFLSSLLVLSLIIWVFQSVSYLDLIIEDGSEYSVYLNYSLLSFPKIISKIFPFAAFIGFFYTISKYEKNNELIIFWNIGIDKKKVINFLFFSSLYLIIIQMILTNFVVPKSQTLAKSLVVGSNVGNLNSFLKPKKFNDTIKGLTIYSKDKEKNGKLIDIYLKKETDDKNFQVTYAKEGKIIFSNDIQKLILYDGETINFINNKISSFKFSRSDFNISNLETNITTYPKIQETSSYELIICYLNVINKIDISDIENCNPNDFTNIFKELYKRIIIPMYISLLILISLILIVFSKEEVNYLKLKIIIFLLGFLTIVFSELSIRLINNSLVENIKILIIPLLVILALFIMINSKLKIKNI